MSSALLLVGRETDAAREAARVHARRVERRGTVTEARAALGGPERVREAVGAVDAADVYAMPAAFARRAGDDPRLAATDRPDRCEPVGRSPSVTAALADRARAAAGGDLEGRSLVLVGLGSGSTPDQRRTTRYHATRLLRRRPVAGVHDCYLLEDPAVECARYETGPDPVVVPCLLAPTAATRAAIRDRLDADWPVAEPLGTHPRVTDAIVGEIERRRAATAAPDRRALADGGGGADDD